MTTLRTRLTVLFILLLLPLAAARIGLPAADVLDAMAADGLLELDAAEQFEVEPVLAGDLLFGLQGLSSGSTVNLERLGLVIGHASGFHEQLAGPVTDFLTANLAGLAEAGTAAIPVEGNFVLLLDVAEDPDWGTVIDWSFSLSERDAAAFQPSRHALGASAADARIVIREFGDLQCPHCATFALQVMPQIEEILAADPGLRFEFHHLPLVTIHPNAIPAAEAAECVAAANLGTETFFSFSGLIFERMQAWGQLPETGPYFIGLAQEAGLATEGVAECLASREHMEHIRDSALYAVSELGLQGTPSVFVDGFQVSAWNQAASFTELIALIDARSTSP